MNAAEIKLDLFRKIDSLKDAELENIYNKFLTLLNSTSPYRLSNNEPSHDKNFDSHADDYNGELHLTNLIKLQTDEKDAINEALEASNHGRTYNHEEVMEEARGKYPNLHFK